MERPKCGVLGRRELNVLNKGRENGVLRMRSIEKRPYTAAYRYVDEHEIGSVTLKRAARNRRRGVISLEEHPAVLDIQ